MIAVVDYRKGNLKSVERGLAAAGADVRITDDAKAIARANAIVLPGVGAFADAAATMRELEQMDVVRDAIARGVPFLGICLGMHLMFEEGEEGAACAPGEGAFACEEEPVRPKGLAVLPGVVAKLPRLDAQGRAYKIPHVGWNSVAPAPIAPASAELAGCARSLKQSCSHETPTGRFGSCGTRFASTPGELGGVEAAGGAGERRGGSEGFDCALFDGIAAGEFFYFTHSYAVPDTPASVACATHSTTFPCAVRYGDCAFGVQFHPEKSSDAGAVLLRNFARIAGEI